MLKASLRSFLSSAVIDPVDKNDYVMRTIIQEGSAALYEVKIIECIQEARRIRQRIDDGEVGLKTMYRDKLRQAATFTSLAVEFTDPTPKLVKEPKTKIQASPQALSMSEAFDMLAKDELPVLERPKY